MEDILNAYRPGDDDHNVLRKVLNTITLSPDDKEYIRKRDAMNKILKKKADVILKHVRDMFPDFKTIEYMSSFTARTNLADPRDMDVDIGVFIPKINKSKLKKAMDKIESVGFQCNDTIVADQYYSCEKIIDSVEFEIKFRGDNKTSAAVLKLHHKIDDLSKSTQDKITIIKKTLKAKANKQYYIIFKALMYNAFFIDIPDSFIIPIRPT
jgi:hypothetical protein